MTFPNFPRVGDGTPNGSNGPAYPIDFDRQPKVLSASFGDGFAQDVVDGFNGAEALSLNITFSNATNQDHDKIEAFLTGLGGAGRFLYTAPYASKPLVFVCQKWRWTLVTVNNWTFSATFERRFDGA